MGTLRTLTVTTLATALLAVPLTASPAAAKASSAPRATPAAPIAGERLVVSGRVPTTKVRTVKLQRLHDGRWKNYLTTRTTRTGKVSFALTSRSSKVSLRFYMPKARIDGRTYEARTSRRLTVPIARATLALSLTPATSGAYDATVTMSPARPNIPVELHYVLRDGTGVGGEGAARRTDSRGQVRFTVRADSVQTWPELYVSAVPTPGQPLTIKASPLVRVPNS